MPTPSKFVEARRRLLLAAVGSGASRRTAAKLAGIHHSQVTRWLRRGDRSAPGGAWRAFRDAFLEAEANPRLTDFPEIPEPTPASEIRWAMRVLRNEWRDEEEPEERPEPLVVKLRFHDGTPVPQHDRRRFD